jgi:DNA-binding transcriptional LysR family regulator
MNSEQLRLFVQVAEHGTLTKAAIAANSLQSVISRQLGALEKECGGRLFYRTGRGVTLTELGAAFLPRVREFLTQLDQLAEDMRSFAEVPAGDVRFGILPALSDPMVSMLYRQAREQHPLVRLHLFEGSNGQLEEWVATGRVDMALLYRYGTVDTASDRVLGTVHACLVGAAGDAVTAQRTLPFRQLQGLPLVLPSVPNALRTTLDQIARREGIELTIVMEADSLPIQKNIAAGREGYAILGRQAVTREIAEGRLQAARIVSPTIERTATLVMTTQRTYTLAMRAVARLIEPLAQELLKEEGGGSV